MGALWPGVTCYFTPRLAALLGQGASRSASTQGSAGGPNGYRRGLQTSSAFQSHAEEAAAGADEPGPKSAEGGEPGPDGEQQLKEEILEASLPFVHSLGWSEDAIAQGAETLGYSSMVHGMFPGGGVELVNYFYGQSNSKLDEVLKAAVEEAQKNPELHKKTTAFIAAAVEERLRMNVEYHDSWHWALALHSSPSNIPTALHNIGTLVDTIWYHSGDRSHDFNWYTKRGILAAVYKSTELCMLQDKSQDFQNTWAFLERRLSDVHSVKQSV
ncbi:ubiquinone biosynthesis protein COQ9, mitochondrial-like isoform X2 [Eriocheir sinensis]|uniref:ubiquinone biosynthesis protein COQ9, mitochondrial-like isoform X2 n=1 Tax=Eriocheir sinensis TaxID=95602 RepID=UPI0021C7FDAC|nr:ubiquinone biosynthesis protein COQ9, mitochondrial-like isoform X2 [Eriocheir sinensis]